MKHITAEDGEKIGPFHVEGIGWPFSSIYSFVSQSRLLTDIHESVTNEVCDEMRKGKILDVGTGPGRLPVKIALKNPDLEVCGVDLSDAMIKIAEQNAINSGLSRRPEFKVGSVYSLPYDNDFFDLVVSTGSFHHWTEPIIGLNEIYRVLKPGKECWIYELLRDLSQDARDEARKKYGWFLGGLGLWFVQRHSSITVDKAKRVEKDSRLLFKNPEVEECGILLKLRFKKENSQVKELNPRTRNLSRNLTLLSTDDALCECLAGFGENEIRQMLGDVAPVFRINACSDRI